MTTSRGRPTAERWDYFEKEDPNGIHKTKRAKCKSCGRSVSATSRNMDTHLRNCKYIKRSLGALVAHPPSTSAGSPMIRNEKQDMQNAKEHGEGSTTIEQSAKSMTSSFRSLAHLRIDSISSAQKREIDEALSTAIHSTATSFNFFDRQEWHNFFNILRKSWKVPSPSEIGGELLDITYKKCMDDVLKCLTKEKSGVIGIDGATNRLSSSTSNVIFHTPKPFFIEYLQSDLKKETANNLYIKVHEVIGRLEDRIGKGCVNGFISDSCNSMRLLRKKLLEKKDISWAYGCATHALHNFSMEIGKIGFVLKVVKQALFVSNTVKNNNVIHKLFDSISMEKYNKRFSMVLFSKTRWTSINYMIKRLLKVRGALAFMPFAAMNEKGERCLDNDFSLPEQLVSILNSNEFWTGLERVHAIFDPISRAIGFLEADCSTVSDSYAVFVYVRCIIKLFDINDHEKKFLDEKLIHHWKRIYSPVHALAFRCDPFYKNFISNINNKYGRDIINLEFGDLNSQCHTAISEISADEAHREKLMNEFLEFSISPEPILEQLMKYHARLSWGQASGYYPNLSAILISIYKSPGSSSGVERNHKVGNNVLTQRRCRLNDLNVQRQVSICHNRCLLQRDLKTKHSKGFEEELEKFGERENLPTLSSDEEMGLVELEDFDEVESLLSNGIVGAQAPEDIGNFLLFVEEDA